MISTNREQAWSSPWLRAILFSIAYFALAETGRRLSFHNGILPIFQPAAGLSVAVLLRNQRPAWPALLLGAFLADIVFDLAHSIPPIASLSAATGNCMAALAGAWLVRRFSEGHTDLASIKDVLSFTLFAAVLGAVVSTACGAAGGAIALQSGSDPSTWFTWWTAHALGTMAIAPPILVGPSSLKELPKLPGFRRVVEAAFILTSLCVCTIMVFRTDLSAGIFPGRYLVFPFIIWCALRFGPRGAAAGGLMLSCLAILVTIVKLGNAELPEPALSERVRSLQAFLGISVFSALALSAAFFERKAAELATMELGSRNLLILDSVDEGIIGLDVNGRIIFVNPSAARMTDYTMEELHGEDLHALLHHSRPDGSPYPKEECPMYRTIHAGTSNRVLDETLWRRDGASFPVSYSSTPTLVRGKIRGAVVTFRDITHRKQANNALLESQSRYRTIFDHASDAIIIHDLAGRILEANQVACDRLDRTREELLQMDLDGIDAPEFAGLSRARNDITLRDGILVFETAHVGRDGTVLPVETNARPIQYGGEQAIISISRDITERKKAEESLRRSEARFRALSEEAPMGISLMNADMTFAYLNRAFTELFGYTLLDLPDKHTWFEKVYPAQELREHGRAAWEENTRRHMEDGKAVEDILTVRCRNGSEKIISSRYIVMDDGRHLQTYQDITGHRKLEARLQQAQKMEAIGTLAGGIAHDFNNILSPIIGFTELAMEEIPKGTRLRHDLEQVLNSSNRAKQLVKQILTFSRMVEQDREPVQVGLLIKEASNLLRASLPSTIEIQLKISRDAASSTVMADPTEIHQILMNLCTNAGHSMREKGGLMEIALNNIDVDEEFAAHQQDIESGRHVRLTVSDTGHGMTEEVKRRLFEPYFTTKGSSEGTGLGLAVVYGIVKKSKGTITFYSEPGMGTVFHVFLPRADYAGEGAVAAEEEIPRGEGRILIVDDEELLVQVEERMLQRIGYQVTSRTSSLEILEVFRRQPDAFDLLITDHTMPGMTGAELAREFLSIRPDFPIVLCTGFSEMIDEAIAKGIGIKAFVMKPVVMRELAGVLQSILLDGDDKTRNESASQSLLA